MDVSQADLEKMNSLPGVSDDGIEEDIDITAREILSLEIQQKGLEMDPVSNRVQLYFVQGKIRMRQDLLDTLRVLQKYRASLKSTLSR